MAQSPILRAAASLASSRTIAELKSRFIDRARELLGVRATGVYLLDESGRAVDFEVSGMPDWLLEEYELSGRARDPLVHYVHEHHSPVHQRRLFHDDVWVALPPIRETALVLGGVHHYMLAPVVRGGRVAGTLNFARPFRYAAFDEHELRCAAVLASHVSATLAELVGGGEPGANGLTARQAQIAERVAKGMTNSEIGAALGISENTVKASLKQAFARLGVHSRAALVSRLRGSRD